MSKKARPDASSELKIIHRGTAYGGQRAIGGAAVVVGLLAMVGAAIGIDAAWAFLAGAALVLLSSITTAVFDIADAGLGASRRGRYAEAAEMAKRRDQSSLG